MVTDPHKVVCRFCTGALRDHYTTGSNDLVMGKEGASNLVSLLSKSLEPVVDMHNNDRVICSCGFCM